MSQECSFREDSRLQADIDRITKKLEVAADELRHVSICVEVLR